MIKLHRTTYCLAALLSLLGLTAVHSASADESESADRLAFRAGQDGEIRFDTGVVRGRLRTDKLAFGIHDVEHCSTGASLGRSVGLFNVYRVFSDGKRYGHAGWEWPSHATVNSDGSVTIRCPAEPGRPFSLSGCYRFSRPDALDLEIQVRPQKDLHGFEVFLASYFDSTYNNAAAYAKKRSEPVLIRATQSLGHWLTFPRDKAAVTMFQDGRWKLPPNPVEWEIQTPLQRPLAVRRSSGPGPTALLMAPSKDCFAISMPYETESHYSIYLSLFGRDVDAQETAACRARLQFLDSPSDQAVIDAYTNYAK